MKLIEEIQKANKNIKEYQPFDVDQEWALFKQHLDPIPVPKSEKGKIRRFSNYGLLRAASILLIIFAIYFISRPVKTENTFTSVSSRDTIHMVEGSIIYLDSFSTVTYPIKLKKATERKLVLNGKATFDVAHHTLPFVVECGDLFVKALGTLFSLAKSDSSIEIVNIRGLIEASSKANKTERIIIKEGETFHFQQGLILKVEPPVADTVKDLLIPLPIKKNKPDKLDEPDKPIVQEKNITIPPKVEVQENLSTYHAEDIIKFLLQQYPKKVTLMKKIKYNKNAKVKNDLSKGMNAVLQKLTEQTTLKTRPGTCQDCIEIYNE